MGFQSVTSVNVKLNVLLSGKYVEVRKYVSPDFMKKNSFFFISIFLDSFMHENFPMKCEYDSYFRHETYRPAVLTVNQIW